MTDEDKKQPEQEQPKPLTEPRIDSNSWKPDPADDDYVDPYNRKND